MPSWLRLSGCAKVHFCIMRTEKLAKQYLFQPAGLWLWAGCLGLGLTTSCGIGESEGGSGNGFAQPQDVSVADAKGDARMKPLETGVEVEGGAEDAGGSGGVSSEGGAGGAAGSSANAGSGGLGGTGGTGEVPTPTSCKEPLPCGSTSCCETILVPGGSFKMGRGEDPTAPDYVDTGLSSSDADETPERSVTVNDFYLDKFAVSVSRFRKFVQEYDTFVPLAADVGRHPENPYSGWMITWNAELPANAETLKSKLRCADGSQVTWRRVENDKESDALPINCISWYVAFAFCVWDGGRLPSEAEWEYAASGGQDRKYAWGSAMPSDSYATFGKRPISVVGNTPAGNGRWNHSDLTGNLWEWVLDGYLNSWYTSSPSSVDHPINTVDGKRVYRGGSWRNTKHQEIRVTNREKFSPDHRENYIGIRCARDVP